MTSPLGGGGTPKRVLEEEEQLPPTSPPSRPSWRTSGAVRWRLEVPTSCIRKGGGAMRRRLELPNSWHEGGEVVRLEGEENLP
jgi:hypothetical protein